MLPLGQVSNKVVQTYQQKQINDKQEQLKEVQSIKKDYNEAELEYLKFMLFPDICQPVRMPRMFPIPTHIWKKSGSQSFTCKDGQMSIIWSPKLQPHRGSLVVCEGKITPGSTPGNHQPTMVNGQPGTPPEVTEQEIDLESIPGGFDWKHVQVTSGVLKVTYEGTLEDLSGRIEIGMAIHDHEDMNQIYYVTQEHIKQTFFYRQGHLGAGVRAIYIPINEEMFTGQNRHEYNHNYAYHILISGAPIDQASIRIDWEVFYEGTPDFSVYNQYLPVKGKSTSDGTKSITGAMADVMNYAAVNFLDKGSLGDQDGFMKKVLYGLNKGYDIVKQYNPLVQGLLTMLLQIIIIQQSNV